MEVLDAATRGETNHGMVVRGDDAISMAQNYCAAIAEAGEAGDFSNILSPLVSFLV